MLLRAPLRCRRVPLRVCLPGPARTTFLSKLPLHLGRGGARGHGRGFGSAMRLLQVAHAVLECLLVGVLGLGMPRARTAPHATPRPNCHPSGRSAIERRRQQGEILSLVGLGHLRGSVVGHPPLGDGTDLGALEKVLEGTLSEGLVRVECLPQLQARRTARQAAAVEARDRPEQRRDLLRAELLQELTGALQQRAEQRLGNADGVVAHRVAHPRPPAAPRASGDGGRDRRLDP